jgi:two-component system OmpR family sensor kinase
MIRSLRARLFVGLTAVIVVTGAVGAFFAYQWAFDEAIEIQDSALVQLASLAQSGRSLGGQSLHGVEEDTQVWLIELGRMPGGTSEDRQLFALPDGLHRASHDGQPVRALLGTRSDGSRFAVTQPTAVRDETARDVAFRTLLPIALLIPCLLLVVALVIAHSLRPLVRLAQELDMRRPDDLAPLSAADTPTEMLPFILSINRLLERVGTLIGQQRRFLADAAHELRTPITALSLQAENLESVELPEPARERVAALRQGMRRTKWLLEQMLAMARFEGAPSSPSRNPLVALDVAAREVVADVLQQALDRGVDLGFERIESLYVRAEPVMVSSIIRNLLDNALRFTPDGGRVDLGLSRDGAAAILFIQDSGPGISSTEIERVFDPFFRGSSPGGEGAGLGLAIVKRIVDGLGGSVTLKSNASSDRTGLRVTITLPAADHSASPVALGQNPPHAPS